MKHATNATGAVTVMDAGKPLTEAIPLMNIPARVLAGEWPVSIASELISAWAAPHGWHNIGMLVSLYRWRTAALWLDTLSDTATGRVFHHAGQDWVISLDMVLMALMEGLEAQILAPAGAGRQANEIIVSLYQRSLDFSDLNVITGLTAEAVRHINGLFELATDHLAHQQYDQPAKH